MRREWEKEGEGVWQVVRGIKNDGVELRTKLWFQKNNIIQHNILLIIMERTYIWIYY